MTRRDLPVLGDFAGSVEPVYRKAGGTDRVSVEVATVQTSPARAAARYPGFDREHDLGDPLGSPGGGSRRLAEDGT